MLAQQCLYIFSLFLHVLPCRKLYINLSQKVPRQIIIPTLSNFIDICDIANGFEVSFNIIYDNNNI